MNRSYLIHGAWLAVAAGAFATGMAVKGSRDTDVENAPGRDLNITAVEAPSALGPGRTLKSDAAIDVSSAGALPDGALSSLDLLASYHASNDPVERNLLFAQMLFNLDASSAPGMYEEIKGQLGGREGGRQMSLFFQAWGKLDGASAVAAAIENAGGGRRGRGGPPSGMNVMAVLSGWASADSSAARDWLGTVEDVRQKSFYTMGLVNGMAKSDPNAATDFVLELAAAQAASGETAQPQRGPFGGGDISSRYIATIASEQIRAGIDTAKSWADALPDGDIKSTAFDQVAESYARQDPELAKAWIAEYADQEYAQRAVREVAERLANDNPQSAMEWAASLPETAQGNAYAETMDRWTRSDAMAASEYLATMDTSPTRDDAVRSFATALDREDPASAATWAATIADESTRTNTLTQVAQSWIRSDAEAAKAWLPTSGLPVETQTQIMENPGRGNPRGRGR